ncbi:polysaccharide deacetylase family protein [Chelativorans sp. M5D2P16]|uniref:polysaccharide deacetylase family protein n=1 Tax=Chelativorans sp. M5D2P16 TaxID=3095678 RepID=UPI002ACAC505|nr:polysaccharide deacetylase family protein [Chelativorans sp. M5D2P16]MDZ5695732.1 polysaccharide deacetylase family protein [Chelativorans sp. M5D2P16]
MRHAVIRAGLEATALSRAARLVPTVGGRGLIFTLHHVRPHEKAPFSPNAALSVTPEFLEKAVVAALDGGLVPVHLHALPALLAEPDGRKFVAFTLDDGYRNNAQFAAPVFRRYGIPYTIFITAGFVERKRTLWWETAAELAGRGTGFVFDFGRGPEEVPARTLAQKNAAFARLAAYVHAIQEDEAVARIDTAAAEAGIDAGSIVRELVMDADELKALAEDPLVHFGAHTVTHVNLRRVPAKRLNEEITESARAVERYVGSSPRSFAYPYGGRSAAGPREMAAVAEAGFSAAVTTQPGRLEAACLEQPTGLPRVSLNGLFQKKRYVAALMTGLPFRFT